MSRLIKNSFQFDVARLGDENLKILKEIKSCNSISVHVRRGDFMNIDNYNKLGAVCTVNYFLTAIEKMRSMVENPCFFFFTNDYSWVKEHFADPAFKIVYLNTKNDSWKDMFLISSCSNHINSNGSFSWWSSWLGNDPKTRLR